MYHSHSGYPRSSPRVSISTLLGFYKSSCNFRTYGDYYFSTWGFLLTVFGTFLAALKTVFTNVLQSPSLPPSKIPRTLSPLAESLLPPRLNLHPLDLLTRMSPYAFVQCALYAYMTGEFARMHPSHRVDSVPGFEWGSIKLILLLGNGLIAFGLNIVSLTANRKVGALNMTVAGMFKLLTFSRIRRTHDAMLHSECEAGAHRCDCRIHLRLEHYGVECIGHPCYSCGRRVVRLRGIS